jgi:UDP-N-acetylmuramoyl-L-alanyl-D-glutamate--2,6-diaminopimelate ligase
MTRRLTELAAAVGGHASGEAEIAGLAVNSREVKPGDIFVAIPGLSRDGEDFVEDACRRGAVAVMARDAHPALPTIVVSDPRAALPHLSAAFYGDPSRRLRLIGVTGTLGKTSTASFIRAAMQAGGKDIGVIGSLGIWIGARAIHTGMTTPDAPVIHAAFREMLDEGLSSAVMEVTSHALLLRRTDGLSFALGVLTNLVPDEHLEFHPTPEHYLETKLRFFDLLAPGAPLIVNIDNALAAAHTRALGRPLVDVTIEDDARAQVSVEHLKLDATGSQFTLRIRDPLPGLVASVAPAEIAVATPLLGREQVIDMALGATAALMAGTSPQAIRDAAANMRPLRRRMELIRAWPMVLDDTTGNPRSLVGVFDFVRHLKITGRIRVVFGLRGMRGAVINEALVEMLAKVAREHSAALVVTASRDAADARNRVQPEEAEHAIETLSRTGVSFTFEPDLRAAVARALAGIQPEDFILLLGAQGMDQAAEMSREILARINANQSGNSAVLTPP